MQALKAVYEDGAVRFIHNPPYIGTFEILVIFPDESHDKTESNEKLYFQGTREMDRIMDAEPEWEPVSFIKR